MQADEQIGQLRSVDDKVIIERVDEWQLLEKNANVYLTANGIRRLVRFIAHADNGKFGVFCCPGECFAESLQRLEPVEESSSCIHDLSQIHRTE